MIFFWACAASSQEIGYEGKKAVIMTLLAAAITAEADCKIPNQKALVENVFRSELYLFNDMKSRNMSDAGDIMRDVQQSYKKDPSGWCNTYKQTFQTILEKMAGDMKK